MNLDLIVDQNHSYRQAVEIAYEKAKRNGGVDAFTAQECELVLSEPEPDYVYHEVMLDTHLRSYEDGCVSFRTLSPRDFYEQVKLTARRCAAESLAHEMDDLWQDIKKTVVGIEPELLSELSFSIDEKGTIKPVSVSGSLGEDDERQLFAVLNNHSVFKRAAREYIWILAGLVGHTIDGLSASCARYFVGYRPLEANRIDDAVSR